MSISSDDTPDLEPDPAQASAAAQQRANAFSPVSPASPSGVTLTAGDLKVLMQQMAAATQAATKAARVAASVAQSDSKCLEVRDLLKILPKPEPFKVDKSEDERARWVSWYWQPRQYLRAYRSHCDGGGYASSQLPSLCIAVSHD